MLHYIHERLRLMQWLMLHVLLVWARRVNAKTGYSSPNNLSTEVSQAAMTHVTSIFLIVLE